jgi:hypothetical protein
MMDNAAVHTVNAENIKADRERSAEKNGAIATIMTLDQAMRHKGSGGSVFERCGVLLLLACHLALFTIRCYWS